MSFKEPTQRVKSDTECTSLGEDDNYGFYVNDSDSSVGEIKYC